MALMVLAKKEDWNGKVFVCVCVCVCVCTEVLVGYIKEKRFFVCFFSHYIKENTVSDLAIPGI